MNLILYQQSGMVQIEDAQQSQVGWLFGRGGGVVGREVGFCFFGSGHSSGHSYKSSAVGVSAFDKADLLYLRDEEEKMRFKEDELRDSERSEFLKLKAKADLDPGKAIPVPRPVKRDKAAPRYEEAGD
jgi:hypothetical protein